MPRYSQYLLPAKELSVLKYFIKRWQTEYLTGLCECHHIWRQLQQNGGWRHYSNIPELLQNVTTGKVDWLEHPKSGSQVDQ